MVFENQLIKEILKKYRTLWALGHAMGLMGWDSETYMPREGVTERAIARAELSVLRQKLLLKPEFVELVEKAKGLEGLNEFEQGVVRVLDREISIMKKLPPEHVYEFTKVTQEAVEAWRIAREKDDFEKFRPYLEKIVELSRKTAEYLGYEEHPYNALLDLYEEGLTIRDMDYVYDSIIPHSKHVLDKVMGEGYFPTKHELEDVKYEREPFEKVNREILDLLGYPWSRGRLDVSPHPFTIGLGVKDVRITTRYEGIDFRNTIYSVIHEYGHALYELQVDERFIATPLASGVSMGVHESQSRFWENIIGRSRSFIPHMKKILDKYVDFVKEYSEEELYRYVNTVRPSLIRVEADEVTYNFHTYLRYQLEKLMIAGEIKVSDLPELWAEEMERLLGVKPKTYREGVLQDIHWSHGSIGYFPTYTLGNVLATQIRAKAEADLNSLREKIVEGDFEAIKAYLKEKIHRWGSTYPPKILIEKATGEGVNPDYFNNYLTEKFLAKKI